MRGETGDKEGVVRGETGDKEGVVRGRDGRREGGTLRASLTERVPRADDFRPVNGKESGLRWHCALMLTLPTLLASASMRGPHLMGSLVKMAA